MWCVIENFYRCKTGAVTRRGWYFDSEEKAREALDYKQDHYVAEWCGCRKTFHVEWMDF